MREHVEQEVRVLKEPKPEPVELVALRPPVAFVEPLLQE